MAFLNQDDDGIRTAALYNASLSQWATYILPCGYDDTSAVWSYWRNNAEGTLLASAARTANTPSPTQTNHNARGVILFLNVTVVPGSGGILPKLHMYDPVSGTWEEVWAASLSVSATGLYIYALYPGVTTIAGFRAIASIVLPRTWRGYMGVETSVSYTYSLGFSYIV